MTWAKFGSEYPEELAFAGLSDAAWRTHTEALMFLYRMESTGEKVTMLIPKRLLTMFARSPDAEVAVKELVAREYWRDRGESWEIRHHAKVVRESISAQRRVRRDTAARVRKHRQKKVSSEVRATGKHVAGQQKDPPM